MRRGALPRVQGTAVGLQAQMEGEQLLPPEPQAWGSWFLSWCCHSLPPHFTLTSPHWEVALVHLPWDSYPQRPLAQKSEALSRPPPSVPPCPQPSL